MKNFSEECDRIIEEMRTRFEAFDEPKKLEYKTEIENVLKEPIPSSEKAEKFKEIKKRFKQDLFAVNYKNIRSLYVRNHEEGLIVPAQNRNKINDIVENAIDLLSNEREDTHVFRRLSFRSLAESKTPQAPGKKVVR